MIAHQRQRTAIATHSNAAIDPVSAIRRAYGLESPSLASFAMGPPRCSLARGASGVAYTLWRTARLNGDQCLLEAAKEWMVLGEKYLREDNAFAGHAINPKVCSLLNGEAGFHFVRALVLHAVGDHAGVIGAINGFLEATVLVDKPADVHAGGLGPAIAIARLCGIADSKHCAILRRRQGVLIDQAIHAYGPDIKEGDYLGFAHGAAGLVYAACLEGSYERVADLAEQVRLRAVPCGRGFRWPMREGESVFMGGWCNGPAGHLLTWLKVWGATGHERDRELAERAAWGVWEARGVVGDLCCGVAGQAIGLACFAAATGSSEWKVRAIDRLRSAELKWSSYYKPESLLYGDLGSLLAWAECLSDSPEFPIYGGV